MKEQVRNGLSVLILFFMGSVSAEVVTSVEAKTSYDSNIYRLQSNDYDAWVTRVSPKIHAVAEQSANTYTLDASAENGNYSQSALGEDNYTDYGVKGLMALEFDIRNRFELEMTSKKGHDDRGMGRMDKGSKISAANVLVSDSVDIWQKNGGRVQYGYGVPDGWGELKILADYNNTDYVTNEPATNVLDIYTKTIGLQGRFRITPDIALIADVIDRDYRYEDHAVSNKDSHEYRYLMGAEWNVSEALKGKAQYGYQQRNADAVGAEDFNSGAWQADITWSPKKYSSFNFTSFKGAEEAKTTASLIDVQRSQIKWKHNWAERLSSEVFYEYRTDNYDSIDRKDRTYKWGVAGTYRPMESLKVYSEYRYEDRAVSTTPGSDLDYVRNVLTFGAEIELK